MILSSWTHEDGEQVLADTFRKSYLDNDLFNKWRYNVSGIPGCIPQNNSHGRSNLNTKGCAAFPVIIKAGQNMTAMLNIEFPNLVYFNSIERTEVERNFPILDQMKSMRPALFEYYLEFNKLVDCVQYKDGFLVNREYNIGEPINAIRVQSYESSLQGDFELDYSSERHFFYHRVNELCFVTKKQLDPKQKPFFTGSCFHFYNHLTCNHAAVFQYADELPTLAKKISQEKQGRKKRRKTGLERPNKYQLRKMAQEQARLTSIGTFNNPSPNHEMCHPITQTQEEAYLV
jgi:hypothetical protein